MTVKLISITKPEIEGLKTAEDLIGYCARVSNPSNQLNTETAPKLLKYCIDHGHWSIFEQASMTVEIKTSRAIAAQVLRHKSFNFQEFSQRYSETTEMENLELRKQEIKNRQSSEEVMADVVLNNAAKYAIDFSIKTYEKLLREGVAKECARMVLPLCAQTTLYMSGNIRSFIHYLQLRTKQDTQKEHRNIAVEIQKIFKLNFPNISKALNWN
jgi:thymidylate synthase (FAD)